MGPRTPKLARTFIVMRGTKERHRGVATLLDALVLAALTDALGDAVWLLVDPRVVGGRPGADGADVRVDLRRAIRHTDAEWFVGFDVRDAFESRSPVPVRWTA